MQISMMQTPDTGLRLKIRLFVGLLSEIEETLGKLNQMRVFAALLENGSEKRFVDALGHG